MERAQIFPSNYFDKQVPNSSQSIIANPQHALISTCKQPSKTVSTEYLHGQNTKKDRTTSSVLSRAQSHCKTTPKSNTVQQNHSNFPLSQQILTQVRLQTQADYKNPPSSLKSSMYTKPTTKLQMPPTAPQIKPNLQGVPYKAIRTQSHRARYGSTRGTTATNQATSSAVVPQSHSAVSINGQASTKSAKQLSVKERVQHQHHPSSGSTSGKPSSLQATAHHHLNSTGVMLQQQPVHSNTAHFSNTILAKDSRTPVQKKKSSASCMRNFLSCCTSDKARYSNQTGRLPSNARTSSKKPIKRQLSPPQPPSVAAKKKLFGVGQHATSSSITRRGARLNTEQNEPNDSQRLMKPLGKEKTWRLSSPNAYQINSTKTDLNKSIESYGTSNTRSMRQKQARAEGSIAKVSSGVSKAQQSHGFSQVATEAAKIGQSERSFNRNNVGGQQLARLKTAQLEAKVVRQSQANGQGQLQQQSNFKKRHSSPTQGIISIKELQSEPFEISPLRSSDKKLAYTYRPTIKPNYPVVGTIRQHQINLGATGNILNTSAPACQNMSMNMSSDLMTNNNEDELPYDRSLYLLPESDTEQAQHQSHPQQLNSSGPKISHMLCDNNNLTTSTNAGRQQNQYQISISSQSQSQSQSHSQIDIIAQHQHNLRQQNQEALEEVKTPQNNVQPKVTTINLSLEDFQAKTAKKLAGSMHADDYSIENEDGNQDRQSQRSSLNHTVSLLNRSDDQSTSQQAQQEQDYSCSDPNTQLSEQTPRSATSKNCTVTTNVVDICISSTLRSAEDIQLVSRAPASQNYPSGYSQSSKTSGAIDNRTLSHNKSNSTTTVLRSKNKSSFLSKATQQQNNSQQLQDQQPQHFQQSSIYSQILQNPPDGSVSLREMNKKHPSLKSPSSVLTTMKRRHSYNKSITVKKSNKKLENEIGSGSHSNQTASNAKFQQLNSHGFAHGVSPLILTSSKSTTNRKESLSKIGMHSDKKAALVDRYDELNSYMSPMLVSHKSTCLHKKSVAPQNKSSNLFMNGSNPVVSPDGFQSSKTVVQKNTSVQHHPHPQYAQGNSPRTSKSPLLSQSKKQLELMGEFNQSEEQVIFEPEIPLPYNNGKQQSNNGNLIHTTAIFSKPKYSAEVTKQIGMSNASSHLSGTNMLHLQHSKSSNAISSVNTTDQRRNSVRKMPTNQLTHTFHQKPKMVHIEKKHDLMTSGRIGETRNVSKMVTPGSKAKTMTNLRASQGQTPSLKQRNNQGNSSLTRYGTKITASAPRRQSKSVTKKRMSKSFQSLSGLTQPIAQVLRQGSVLNSQNRHVSKSPRTYRHTSSKAPAIQGVSTQKQIGRTVQKPETRQMFNPRQTIGVQPQSLTSFQDSGSSNLALEDRSSKGPKTPLQHHHAKSNSLTEEIKSLVIESRQSIGSRKINIPTPDLKVHDASSIKHVDVKVNCVETPVHLKQSQKLTGSVLQFKNDTDEEKNTKSMSARNKNPSQTPSSSCRRPRSVRSSKGKAKDLGNEPRQDPPRLTSSESFSQLSQQKAALASQKREQKPLTTSQFSPVKNLQTQAYASTHNFLQTSGSLVVSATGNSSLQAAQQQKTTMFENGGFQKLEQVGGDDQSEDEILSGYNSQSTSQQIDSLTQVVSLTGQLIVTRVTRRRCLSRYQSQEDQMECEPPSQMEKHSFGSLRQLRDETTEKSRSMSQKKRLMFQKFLTTSGSTGLKKAVMSKSVQQLKNNDNNQNSSVEASQDQDSEVVMDRPATLRENFIASSTSPLEEFKEQPNPELNNQEESEPAAVKLTEITIEVSEVTPEKKQQETADKGTEQETQLENDAEGETYNAIENTPECVRNYESQLQSSGPGQANDTPCILLGQQRISKDLPKGLDVSKIFRQIEQSRESNLLDDLSKSLDKANKDLLNEDNLLSSKLLLLSDNPLDGEDDDEALLGDGGETDDLLAGSTDDAFLNMLDDPINDDDENILSMGAHTSNDRNNPLLTPTGGSNQQINLSLADCGAKGDQNMFTPDGRLSKDHGSTFTYGDNNLSCPEESKKTQPQTARKAGAYGDFVGSLSVISEEQSMCLYESISAASSKQLQGLHLSQGLLSSTFNSAHKSQQQQTQQQIFLRRNVSEMSQQMASAGAEKAGLSAQSKERSKLSSSSPDSKVLKSQSPKSTQLYILRQHSGCNPFIGNILVDENEELSQTQNFDKPMLRSELNDNLKVSDEGDGSDDDILVTKDPMNKTELNLKSTFEKLQKGGQGEAEGQVKDFTAQSEDLPYADDLAMIDGTLESRPSYPLEEYNDATEKDSSKAQTQDQESEQL